VKKLASARAGRHPEETISKLAYTVSPAKTWVQKPAKNLDSGIRRNDDQRRLSHFEMISKKDEQAC